MAQELLPAEAVRDRVLVGELSLDGRVKPVAGALSIGMVCRKTYELILPADNAPEAAVVEGVQAYPVHTLPEAVEFLQGTRAIPPAVVDHRALFASPTTDEEDFADVKGQEHAKRALEVAAAGGHNVLMIGPPGSGKTMLARRLSGILPPMEPEEAIVTTRVHSVAGLLSHGPPLITTRPFRAPHHSISDAGLIGGGAVPRPGEVSLAHHGVLFLDEIPEFKRHVLEGLRQPLEDGTVILTRVSASLRYPARVMLVAAMNPCPCGYFNHPERECTCPPGGVQKYLNKISGPLLDRIDLHVEVTPVAFSELSADRIQEGSAAIRERVIAARAVQAKRYEEMEGIYCNAQMSSKLLKEICAINAAGHKLLKTAMQKLNLSARAYDRILKVSRTIADLSETNDICTEHLAEAIQYRSLDREGWAR